MSPELAAQVISAASVGAVSWVVDGLPSVRGVVPLVREGRPVVAFTYADEAVARSMASAPVVTLSLTETRATGSAFSPVAVSGTPRLVEDPSGERFVGELLLQELRRYPPARLLADSPLLQREHWWYLPRLIVDIAIDSVTPLAPTEDPVEERLLVVAAGGGPVVRSARLEGGDPTRVSCAPADAPPPGPAVLFGQDATFPDLELWSQWCHRGRWDGWSLHVERAPSRTGLGQPPNLRERWRRQRDLRRRCVAAIPPT